MTVQIGVFRGDTCVMVAGGEAQTIASLQFETDLSVLAYSGQGVITVAPATVVKHKNFDSTMVRITFDNGEQVFCSDTQVWAVHQDLDKDVGIKQYRVSATKYLKPKQIVCALLSDYGNRDSDGLLITDITTIVCPPTQMFGLLVKDVHNFMVVDAYGNGLRAYDSLMQQL